jgi:DNA invertase Pin-like site-specific DNA recombinase
VAGAYRPHQDKRHSRGYLRASVLHPQQEREAVDRFIQDGYDICSAKNWTPVEEFVDDDTSASTGKRRERYRRMREWIRTGKIDERTPVPTWRIRFRTTHG